MVAGAGGTGGFLLWADLAPEAIATLDALTDEQATKETLVQLLSLPEIDDPLKTEVLLELHLNSLYFARRQGFSAEKTSALFSIIKRNHDEMTDAFLPPQKSWEFFKALLLAHSVQRPPHSIGLFTREDCAAITQFVLDTYYRHFKLYRCAPAGRLPAADTRGDARARCSRRDPTGAPRGVLPLPSSREIGRAARPRRRRRRPRRPDARAASDRACAAPLSYAFTMRHLKSMDLRSNWLDVPPDSFPSLGDGVPWAPEPEPPAEPPAEPPPPVEMPPIAIDADLPEDVKKSVEAQIGAQVEALRAQLDSQYAERFARHEAQIASMEAKLAK